MESNDDALALWSGIDKQLNSSLLSKITSIIECSVCSETMHVPFTTECGHSFCYDCIRSWFENKLNCPSCRHEIEKKPVLNIQLKDIARSMTDVIIDTRSDGEEKNSLIKQRQQSMQSYEADVQNNKLFGDLFKSALTFVDNSDGVPRCGVCHWEAHGSVCLQCGTRFRIPREEEYDSADDEDFYSHTGDTPARGSEDEYDSADSFVDSRGLEEIDRDRVRSADDDILSSGSSHEAWEGFGEGGSDADYHSGAPHSPIILNDEEDYYDSDDIIEALDEFHESHLNEYDDSIHSDSDVQPGRRRRVIDISDDED